MNYIHYLDELAYFKKKLTELSTEIETDTSIVYADTPEENEFNKIALFQGINYLILTCEELEKKQENELPEFEESYLKFKIQMLDFFVTVGVEINEIYSKLK